MIPKFLLIVFLCLGHSSAAPTPGNYCGEYTPFNDICVQVKSGPAQFRHAEKVCNSEGGHLISIHNKDDNAKVLDLIKREIPDKVAVLLGALGESESVYNYTDGTPFNYQKWADHFPNNYLGNSVQMLVVDSDAGNAGEWANVVDYAEMPYICARPNTPPEPACPHIQWFNDNGEITSPGYPGYLPSNAKCTYMLAVDPEHMVSFVLSDFETDNTTTLELIPSLMGRNPFYTLSGNAIPMTINSTGNLLKLVFTTGSNASGYGWKGSFSGI